MDSLKLRFGRNLRYWRKIRGMTQENLADELGITVHSISNMERGIHGPRFATIEKLTGLLGIDVAALFLKATQEQAELKHCRQKA